MQCGICDGDNTECGGTVELQVLSNTTNTRDILNQTTAWFTKFARAIAGYPELQVISSLSFHDAQPANAPFTVCPLSQTMSGCKHAAGLPPFGGVMLTHMPVSRAAAYACCSNGILSVVQVRLMLPALSWSASFNGSSWNQTLNHTSAFDAQRVLASATQDAQPDNAGRLNARISSRLLLVGFDISFTCGDGVCSRDELWADWDGLHTSCQADCGAAVGACTPPGKHDLPWATQPSPLVPRRNAIYTMMAPEPTIQVQSGSMSIKMQFLARHMSLCLRHTSQATAT